MLALNTQPLQGMCCSIWVLSEHGVFEILVYGSLHTKWDHTEKSWKIQLSTHLCGIHKHGWKHAEESFIKTYDIQHSISQTQTNEINYYIKSTASMVETWTSNPIVFILLSSVFDLQDLTASKERPLFTTWTTQCVLYNEVGDTWLSKYDRGLKASIDWNASNVEVFWGFWQEQVAHVCAKSSQIYKKWQSCVTLAAALLQRLLSSVRSCLAPKSSRLHLRC